MRSLISAAIICAATLGSLSIAEAMPAALNPAPAASAISGAQLDKVVVVVTKRVVVRRPRRVVKRVIIR